MYVICIMYFISATINFMKFKLNLILNKKENDQQMQNGKKKKRGGILEMLGQARLKQAFTISSITVTDVTVHCYRCDTSFINVKFLALV